MYKFRKLLPIYHFIFEEEYNHEHMNLRNKLQDLVYILQHEGYYFDYLYEFYFEDEGVYSSQLENHIKYCLLNNTQENIGLDINELQFIQERKEMIIKYAGKLHGINQYLNLYEKN